MRPFNNICDGPSLNLCPSALVLAVLLPVFDRLGKTLGFFSDDGPFPLLVYVFCNRLGKNLSFFADDEKQQ
jgi:hypothetical protein